MNDRRWYSSQLMKAAFNNNATLNIEKANLAYCNMIGCCLYNARSFKSIPTAVPKTSQLKVTYIVISLWYGLITSYFLGGHVANHTSALGQSERPAPSADQWEAPAAEAGADSVSELAGLTRAVARLQGLTSDNGPHCRRSVPAWTPSEHNTETWKLKVIFGIWRI